MLSWQHKGNDKDSEDEDTMHRKGQGSKENLYRGKSEIAQYGCEKLGSNKWNVGKERNPTDFKNTHY